MSAIAAAPRASSGRLQKRRVVLGVEIAASLLIIMLPGVLPNAYFVRILVDIAVFSLLAMGLNLVFGYTGQISLGHAAFYAIGAYGCAILETKAGVPITVAWPAAIVLSMVVAWIISFPVLRLRGHYLALGTLAIGLIASTLIGQGGSFTGGHDGIIIPVSRLLGPFLSTYLPYVVVVVAIIAYWALRNLTARSIGRAMLALRDDPDAAASLGIPVVRYRTASFVIAGGLAAIAGIFYTHIAKVITPEVFSFDVSIQILVMVIVGGTGHRLGGFLGAAVVLILPELLNPLQQTKTLTYSILVILVLLFLPNGIAGLPATVRNLARRIRRAYGNRGGRP